MKIIKRLKNWFNTLRKPNKKLLSKEIRHIIYTKTLSYLVDYNYKTKGYDIYICHRLKHFYLVETQQIENNQYFSYSEIISQFPELLKHKPYKRLIYDNWFPYTKEGYEKRIKILKQAINETK